MPQPSPTSTTLVIGGAAPSTAGYGYDLSLRALRQLRARSSRLVLTDRAENLAAAPEAVALADEVHVLDYADPADCVAWSWAWSRGRRFDAVVGFHEYAMESVAAVAEALGLPGNPLASVQRVRLKDRCRDYLRQHGFRQPTLRLCTVPEQAVELLRGEGRVVVKPRDSANGKAASLVTDPARLPDAFRTAGAGADRPVLVETWVEGAEYSVVGMFVAGRPRILAVARKHLAPAGFVETGHTMPSGLPPEAETAVRAEVSAALQVLDLRAGPFHVECWTGPRGVVLGAVHVRQGGDWIHAMLEWCHPGLEVYGSWLDDLLGKTVALPPATRAAAVRFLLPEPGTVRQVRGWEGLADLPGVLAVECALAPGDRVEPVRSNGDRRGSVVVGATDPAEARRWADSLLARIRVEVVPLPLRPGDSSATAPIH